MIDGLNSISNSGNEQNSNEENIIEDDAGGRENTNISFNEVHDMGDLPIRNIQDIFPLKQTMEQVGGIPEELKVQGPGGIEREITAGIFGEITLGLTHAWNNEGFSLLTDKKPWEDYTTSFKIIPIPPAQSVDDCIKKAVVEFGICMGYLNEIDLCSENTVDNTIMQEELKDEKCEGKLKNDVKRCLSNAPSLIPPFIPQERKQKKYQVIGPKNKEKSNQGG